ncbi:YbaN family protein [Mycoplasmatota bacterium]|nr:YbaN family protein [Mycoplasmatota bacterium]
MRNKIKKYVFIFLGTIFLILGAIGVILPILPTTPFLLLSAFLYLRSSKRLYHWLLNHKILGIYIYSYITYHAIDLKTKITSISLLWMTLIISMIIVSHIYITLLLTTIGLAVSFHLILLKTLSKAEMIRKREKNTYQMNLKNH